jgi:exopolyphosphatase/guanosine-5'-triphosphate,3'-diphosphate pyrophosphatase
MPNIAAIDIGSNAIRMTIAETSPGQTILGLRHFREPVRLGQDVFEKGMISEQIASRALQALKSFKAEADKAQASRIRMVATEALRRAANGRELAEAWSAETGVEIEVIIARREAVLLARAISERPDLKDKNILHFELGGGSLELSLISKGKVEDTADFELGAVRLLKIIEPSAGDKQRLKFAVEKLSQNALDWVKHQVSKRKPQLLAGTGGGVEALAELASNNGQSQSKDILTSSGLNKVIDLIIPLTPEQRTAQLGLKPDRADVILPAALVVSALIGASGFDRLHLPRVSLRDGMLLEMAGEMPEQKA